jgi:hypothetical protein
MKPLADGGWLSYWALGHLNTDNCHHPLFRTRRDIFVAPAEVKYEILKSSFFHCFGVSMAQ